MSSLRILVIHNAYTQRGGEDTVVEQEEAALRERGHEVVLLLVHNDDVDDAGAVARVGRARRAIWSKDAAEHIATVASAFRPDVAHVHNQAYELSASILPALERLGIPVVATLHNYEPGRGGVKERVAAVPVPELPMPDGFEGRMPIQWTIADMEWLEQGWTAAAGHPLSSADRPSSQRKKDAASGVSMKGGGYPIRNANDLKNAKQAIGRAAPAIGRRSSRTSTGGRRRSACPASASRRRRRARRARRRPRKRLAPVRCRRTALNVESSDWRPFRPRPCSRAPPARAAGKRARGRS
jgi:hypothetical protein